jgi:ATP-dependent Lhr-like helicase
LDRLAAQGRAHCIDLNGEPAWVATERLPDAALLWPSTTLPQRCHPQRSAQRAVEGPATRSASTPVSAPLSAESTVTRASTLTLTQGWLQLLGPTTAENLAALTHLDADSIHQSLLAMEMQGIAMRGVFEHPAPAAAAPHLIEWCERRILQRIHRLTLGTLRKQVEPVSPAVFMRWLLDWHHLAPAAEPGAQPTGEAAVLEAIEQLEGFEAPAIEWERTLLPRRVANYSPAWLDNLCLSGVLGWGRISPHPAWTSGEGMAPRRVIPSSAAPITFYLREASEWLHHALASKCVEEPVLAQSLSAAAQQLRALLAVQGACFAADLQRLSGLSKPNTNAALWELATAGLAAADGFDQLRALMDPRRKSAAIAQTRDQTPAASLRKRAAARATAGRWSLLCDPAKPLAATDTAAILYSARRTDTALDAHARILLCRYGVLFRELLARESNAPKWRDLLPILRRLEARGEVRGGRFVSGAFGEQFALPEAVDSLRTARNRHPSRANDAPIAVAAADPLNLVGILVPGERVPAVPGREVLFTNGVVLPDVLSDPATIAQPRSTRRRSIPDMLRAEAIHQRPSASPIASPGLFS